MMAERSIPPNEYVFIFFLTQLNVRYKNTIDITKKYYFGDERPIFLLIFENNN